MTKEEELAWNYGHHRAKEVLEHVLQELTEQEVTPEYKYMFWRGWAEGIGLND